MPEPQGDCGRSNEVGAATVFVVTDIAKSTAHYPRRARLNGGDVAYWPSTATPSGPDDVRCGEQSRSASKAERYRLLMLWTAPLCGIEVP